MQDLNQQQLEYIDDRMRVAQFVNLDRPENNKSMRIAMDLNQLATPNSSYITSQAVGRYIANLVRAEQNLPRAHRKTPYQVHLLEDSFGDEPYPNTWGKIRLMALSGLSKTQVSSWFDNKRKQIPGILTTYQEPDSIQEAARQWREYKKDPEGINASLVQKEVEYEIEKEAHFARGGSRPLDPIQLYHHEDTHEIDYSYTYETWFEKRHLAYGQSD